MEKENQLLHFVAVVVIVYVVAAASTVAGTSV